MPNYIFLTRHGETCVLEDEEEEYDDTISNYVQYSFFVDVVMREIMMLRQMLHDKEKTMTIKRLEKTEVHVRGPKHFVIPRL